MVRKARFAGLWAFRCGVRGRIMKKTKFVKAQLGRKPKREESFAILIDKDQLAGDHWRKIDERSWRTGVSESESAEIARAKEFGSITAWRSFEQPSLKRWLWVEVIPFETPEDAIVGASLIGQNLLSNSRSSSQLLTENPVADSRFGPLGIVWAVEQNVSGQLGTGSVFLLSGASANVVFAMSLSGPQGSLDWSDIIEIASTQVEIILNGTPQI